MAKAQTALVKPKYFLDRLGEVLGPLGFERDKATFTRRTGDMLMCVWLETEPRHFPHQYVDPVVTVGNPTLPEESAVYYFSLAEAVRGDIQKPYTPMTRGWPDVVIDDFVRVALPFVNAVESIEDVVDGLLDMRWPPNRGVPLLDHAKVAWRLASEADLPEKAQAAVTMLASRSWGWAETEEIRWFADRFGMPIVLPDPRGFRLLEKIRFHGRD